MNIGKNTGFIFSLVLALLGVACAILGSGVFKKFKGEIGKIKVGGEFEPFLFSTGVLILIFALIVFIMTHKAQS